MKCIDITTPVSYKWQKSLAKLMYSITALNQYVDEQVGQKITINYIESVDELGTQDGSTYTVKPVDDCSCEPDLQCYIHAGYFTEKH